MFRVLLEPGDGLREIGREQLLERQRPGIVLSYGALVAGEGFRAKRVYGSYTLIGVIVSSTGYMTPI